jgi:peptidoglycan hydrolase CwlO-like protein
MMVHDDDSLSRIQESLKAAVKRNSEAPLGNGPLYEQAKRFAYESEDRQRKLQRSFQEMASMQKEIDALEPQIKSSRQIVIATFILGTLLTISGTYLEKRNKPAP